MHIAQLVFQHNDLVKTEDDCRNKYIARQLFLKLAKQGRLSTFGFAEDDWSAQSHLEVGPGPSNLSPAPSGTDSFRIWCDNFRPSNMLLNEEDDIVAIIDWEFAYVAPTQFALDPPWWLLLKIPEWWKADIDDWTKNYEVRLRTWLRMMEKASRMQMKRIRSCQDICVRAGTPVGFGLTMPLGKAGLSILSIGNISMSDSLVGGKFPTNRIKISRKIRRKRYM